MPSDLSPNETGPRRPGPESTPPTKALLTIENVSKQYGEGEEAVLALNDVSLKLYGGRIVGLLGPNGAGKTTLLRICATLLAPTKGQVQLCDFNTVEDPTDVRSHLGYLSAGSGVYERLSPEEIMRYFGQLHGMSKDQIKQRTDLLFDRLGINEFRTRGAGKLSTGMKQKVAIARAFLHDPPVLILDEPTNGLDILVRQDLMDLLRDSAQPDRLIILSTHDLPEAQELCDSYVFINQGEILVHGDKADVIAGKSSLRQAFFDAVRSHSA